MSTEKSIEQLKEDMVANYKEQIAILKSMNESNERIINLYKGQQENSDKYIAVLKDEVFKLQQQVIKVL